MDKVIRQACATVVSEQGELGIAYLVAPQWAVTSGQAAGWASSFDEPKLRFVDPNREVRVTVHESDMNAGYGILALQEEVTDREPLRLTTFNFRGAPWEAYNVSAVDGVNPWVLGSVADLTGQNAQGQPAVVLEANADQQEIAADLPGGTPILVGGEVVGHIRKEDLAGPLLVCGASTVLAFMRERKLIATNQYVHRASLQEQALRKLRDPGSGIAILWGPKGLGKSALFEYLCRHIEGQVNPPCRVARIDLNRMPEGDEKLSREFALRVGAALDIGNAKREIDKLWSKYGQVVGLERFMETYVLATYAPPVLLAIDEQVERVEDTIDRGSYGILAMLAGWAENRRDKEPWSRLRQLITLSATPGYLVEAFDSPLFKEGTIKLHDGFSNDQISEVPAIQSLSRNAQDIVAIRDLVDGRPDLLQLVAGAAAGQAVGSNVSTLLAQTSAFDGHISKWVDRLNRWDSAYRGGLKRVGLNPSAMPVDVPVRERLLACGLIRQDVSNPNMCRLFCRLYERITQAI